MNFTWILLDFSMQIAGNATLTVNPLPVDSQVDALFAIIFNPNSPELICSVFKRSLYSWTIGIYLKGWYPKHNIAFSPSSFALVGGGGG